MSAQEKVRLSALSCQSKIYSESTGEAENIKVSKWGFSDGGKWYTA